MSLDAATVRRIASLARIRLEEEEVGRMQAELNGILGWIEQLQGVDTDGDRQIDYVEFINMMKNSLGMEICMDNPVRKKNSRAQASQNGQALTSRNYINEKIKFEGLKRKKRRMRLKAKNQNENAIEKFVFQSSKSANSFKRTLATYLHNLNSV